MSLIAEIKKASPSGGLLRPNFVPGDIARVYSENGAACLSVLTDEKYFMGSLDYLQQARAACKLPILRKDFIVDEYQIVEAERYGADAILLIVANLEDTQLCDLREAAEGEGLSSLVEVHDEHEMERALKSGARIVGINNRNLKTMKTDVETTFRLLHAFPRGRDEYLVVSESGIRSNAEIVRLTEAGVNAVLIGETFMRANDIGEKVRELMGTHMNFDYSI